MKLTKSINQLELIFRNPKITDAREMLKYINTLSLERTYIRFQGEQLTLKEETVYLKEQIKLIKKNKAVKILVFHKTELIGIADVNMKDKTECHLGLFGITIKKEYRGQGIGKELMKLCLTEANKQLKGLKIIILEVFAPNKKAVKMYQGFGFKQYGLLPKGACTAKGYVNSLEMYKTV